MATSGRINGTPYANGSNVSYLYAFWTDWQVNSSSIERNTSNVTVYLRLKRIDGTNAGAYAYDVTPAVDLYVGGEKKSPSITYIDTRNQVVCTFAAWTGDVKHNADGTLNCPISANFTHYGSSTLTNGTLSGYANLDTIPQATSFDNISCSTSYFTGTMTAWYTPKASTLYNRCRVEFNQNGSLAYLQDFDFGNKSASQQASQMTLSGSSLNTVYNRLTSYPASGVLRFTFITYSDSGYTYQVGSASAKELTLSVPETADTKPAATMSLSPVGSLPATFNGLYIQGKTRVKASVSATPKYGTNIPSQWLTVEGKSYGSGENYTSDYLAQYGSSSVYGYAKDGRGFTGSTTQTINVIAYSKPKLQGVVATRCDQNGNPASDGTYLKISAEQVYSPVVANGVQKNFCSISYRYKPEGGNYGGWTTILAKGSSSNKVTTGALLNGNFSKTSTYAVQIRAEDDVGDYAEETVFIPTENIFMHRTQNAMGLGKYVEHNGLDMGWDIHMNGNRVTGLPEPANDTDAVPLGYVDPKYALSGFGLGEGGGRLARDLNEAVHNGWYNYNNATPNAPDTGSYWMRVSAYSSSYIYQEVFQDTRCVLATRWCKGGAWQPWEWVNPPMVLGTEYRTTERFDGKPVYIRYIGLGSAPNNTYKIVSAGISDVLDTVVCVYGCTLSGNPLPYYRTDGGCIELSYMKTSDGGFLLKTNDNFSSETCYGVVKFTKTTD